MRRYVEFVVRHAIAVLLAVAAVTLLLCTQLPHVHLEHRLRALLPDKDPNVDIHYRIGDLFGAETYALVGLTAAGGDVFTPAMLGKVDRITRGLGRIRGAAPGTIRSLAAPPVKKIVGGSEESLEILPLMEKLPATVEEAHALRDVVRREPLIRDTLVSADESATLIVVEFTGDVTDVELAQGIERVVAPERDDSVTIVTSGGPVLRGEIARNTSKVAILFPFAVFIIALVHYEAFRTVQAMILPLVTALLSVIWALGFVGLFREPLDSWSALTPLVILAVAAGHAVQILKRYYEEFAQCRDSDEAVVRSVTAVGPVMLTAGFVAAAGFGSLLTFGVTSMRVFGLLLASGIVSALVIEMTFTPACRSLLSAPKERELGRAGESHWVRRPLAALAAVIAAHPRRVLAVAVATVALAAAGTASLHADTSFHGWFGPGSPIQLADDFLNGKFHGATSINILIAGREPNALQRPAVLQAMQDLEAQMRQEGDVGGITSVADYVQRMHQAMNGDHAQAFAIPDNERLVAQYLLLYSMSGPDTLGPVVDSGYQNAVIRGFAKRDDAGFARALLTRLRRFAAERFAGLPVDVGIAGGMVGAQTAMNDTIVREKLMNMIQIAVIIFVLSAAVTRSLTGGLFVLVPVAMAVVVNLGLMGWVGAWLDMAAAAFTAMGASIGADFAIYMIFRIREEMSTAESLDEAVVESLKTSGEAIFFVSSAVAMGYLALTLARFSLWTRLGLFTSVIIAVSAAATVAVIPALALLLRPRFLTAAAQTATAPRGPAIEAAG